MAARRDLHRDPVVPAFLSSPGATSDAKVLRLLELVVTYSDPALEYVPACRWNVVKVVASGAPAVEQRHVERKLAAILAADVAGYSRLMGGDEEGRTRPANAARRARAAPRC